jgi:hypothetical protein
MSAPDPAEELRGLLQQTVTDLAELSQRLPADPAEADRAALIMDRLGEECAEAAAMLRALPGWPRKAPGYTFAAAAAITRAAGHEHDFGRWLAMLLCQAAARLGSSDALVKGRPGGWEARDVLHLVRQTAGDHDEHLSRYKDGPPC